MSFIPTGRPLDRALPDLPDLLADPVAYLRAAPLAIGPPPFGRMALLLGLPGAMLLLWAANAPDTEWAAWIGGGALLLVALLLGMWALVLRGNLLVFRVEGLDIARGGTTVRVPWAAFNAGERLVATEGGLVVPVNTAAVAGIAPPWTMASADEAALPGRWEIAASDIADLLLVLGRELGGGEPAPPAPRRAEGWHVVPLALLKLPPVCASCAGVAEERMTLRVAAKAELAVPLCVACKRRIAQGRLRGGTFGLAGGALLGAVCGMPFGMGWMAVGFLLGCLAGALVGLRLGRRLPVRVRRWSPSRGLASVRFDNPAVAAAALAKLEPSTKN